MKRLWARFKDWYFQEREWCFDTRWFYLRVVKETTWRHKSRSERFREVYWRVYFRPGGDDHARYESDLPRFENQTLWGGKHCFVRLSMDPYGGENVATVGFGIPGFATWFSLEHRPIQKRLGDWFKNRYKGDKSDRGVYVGEGREIGFSVHDWTFRWDFWMPIHSGRSDDPWYRRGHVGADQIADIFLGRERREDVVVREEARTLELPEGTYPVKVKLTELQFKRPRWPMPRVVPRTELDFNEKPVPIPGKGENSYDCDEDATYSSSCHGHDVDKALAEFKEHTLKTRERRGGKNWRPEACRA